MSVIQAGNTTSTSLIYTGDTTGNLVFTTGGSNTTALTLTNAQNATFAGTVTATGGVVVGSSAAPAFSAYRVGNQSISASTWTKVQLNTEVFDTNNNFDSTTNYRFTPTVAGYYQFNASILYTFGSGTSGVTLTAIYKNGSVYIQNECTATVPSGHSVTTSALIYMNGTTDYVEMWGYAGNATAAFNETLACTTLSGSLVRSA